MHYGPPFPLGLHTSSWVMHLISFNLGICLETHIWFWSLLRIITSLIMHDCLLILKLHLVVPNVNLVKSTVSYSVQSSRPTWMDGSWSVLGLGSFVWFADLIYSINAICLRPTLAKSSETCLLAFDIIVSSFVERYLVTLSNVDSASSHIWLGSTVFILDEASICEGI